MCRIQIGQPAPHFTCTAVVDGLLKEVSLSAYTEASHWVVLLFFPKAWSPVCPTEIKAFSARLEEFLYSRACAVVFASTDNPDCLRAWNNAAESDGGLGGVHLPLISDCNHQLSQAYGVLNEAMGVAQRAFFLIDPMGIVRAISSNDAYVARNVNEVLRLLDALIFKDEFGEGCPADWQKGDEGIDIAKDKIEGVLEIKKSFSKWLRPKLERAISGPGIGIAGLKNGNGNANHSVTSFASAVENSKKRISDDRPDSRGPTSGNVSYAPSVVYTPGVNSVAYTPSASSSGPTSPLISPKAGDYFSVQRLSNSRGLDLRLQDEREEAMMQRRMENMNAALENHRLSAGGVGTGS